MSKRAASIVLALSWLWVAGFGSLNLDLWASETPVGLFENHADVGSVLHRWNFGVRRC